MTHLMIPKEQIAAHILSKSPNADNLLNLQKLKNEFHRAMLVGNNSKSKVKIELQTVNGPVMVETTVWASTESCITLKGGIHIHYDFINSVDL